MIHHVTRVTRLLIFCSLIAGAIGLTATRIILSEVENYKTQLEQKFYELTNIKLRIGSLRAGTRGFNPEIILKQIDIQSFDPMGQPAVTLKEARLGIDMLKLLFNRDLLSASWLSLVGAKLMVIRQPDGQLTIKGLNAGETPLPLWLLKGWKYEILQSEVSWLDNSQSSERITFSNVDALVKNGDGRHQLHLLASLPGKYGDSIRISALGDNDLLSLVNGESYGGTLYLEGHGIQLAELPKAVLPFGMAVSRGVSSFQLWSEWRDSNPYRVSGNIQGKSLKFRQDDGQTLVLNGLGGYFCWAMSAEGWQIDVRDLQLAVPKQQWPLAELSVFVAQNGNLAARIPYLDLQEASFLASFFLPAKLKQQLPKKLALAGRLEGFSIYTSDDWKNYAIDGSFSEIGFTVANEQPHFKGLSGRIHGSREQGAVQLSSNSGSVTFPELFRKAISFEQASGKINWHNSPTGWRFSSQALTLVNADLRTNSAFDILLPHGDQPVFIDLRTAFAGSGEINRTPAYLPVKLIGSEVVEWLDHAFVAGHLQRGDLLFYGNVDAFPFTAGQGKFEVLFDVVKTTLRYHPEWPLLTEVDARVHFFADSLRVDIRHAGSEDITVKRARVDFANLSHAESLFVEGQLQGRIADGLTFMEKTPLHASIDALQAASEIEGVSEAELKLTIPLTDSVTEKVDGVLHVHDSSFNIPSAKLQINGLKGDLHFNETGVFCERMDGNLLGYPLRAWINTDDQGVVRIVADGTADIKQLQQQFSDVPDSFAQGQFPYTALVALPKGKGEHSMIEIVSNLRGVTLDLPEPLAKPADEEKYLQVVIDLSDDQTLPISIGYSDQIKMVLRLDRNAGVVRSGHIVFGRGQALDRAQAGIRLDVDQPVFPLADWLALIKQDSESQQTELHFPDVVNVDIEKVLWNGQNLGKLTLIGTRVEKSWQARFSSLLAQGRLNFPLDAANENLLSMQLGYLDLTRLSEIEWPKSPIDRDQLLPINIVSEQVRWQGKNLGRLELQTEKKSEGLHFKIFRLSGRSSQLDLTGDWIPRDNDGSTRLQGRLTSRDFGQFLSRLGHNDEIKDGEGSVEFSGHWAGPPYHFSLATFDGEMQVDIKDGRISSIEPGFGRLLGLIAMEQWFKRLSLDFSDIYQQGMSFNHINGHIKIRDGSAQTRDLLIDAIPARVRISGKADLLNKTWDHRILVVPKSSGAVPIAGTIVGSIASMVTQALTDDYKEGYFFGSEYQVEGPWGHAEITPLHDRDGLLKKTWSELTDFPWLKQDVN